MANRTPLFRLKPTQAVVLVALVVASAVTQGGRAAAYTVTDLGTLGGEESYATGINESGQVVGVSDTHTPFYRARHAFLYSGGTMTDLGTLGGRNSYASAINAAGQVVGVSDWSGTGAQVPFLYSGGTMNYLTAVLLPSAINAAGQITGATIHHDFRGVHAFVYGINQLGTLGGRNSYATAINDAKLVVGVSDVPGNGAHAFMHVYGGTMTDLGTLGGTNSYASAVNAAGQIVGQSQIPGDGAHHAFLYSGGTMTDLGTLGGRNSYASAINAAGQIVGNSDTPGNGIHAFLYSGGTMTDLNTLVPAGVTVVYATGINAAGQIVGVGRIGASANARALLLTPTVLE